MSDTAGTSTTSSTAGDGSGSEAGDGSGTGSTTASTGTGTTGAGCDPIQLADIAAGVGGFAMDGEDERHNSGYSVSGAGDVNGDGFGDVLVGAPRASANGFFQAGRIYVVFGKANTGSVSPFDVAQGSGGFVLDGEGSADYAGYSVSRVGDMNGDGLADVIVGAPNVVANGLFSGRAYVVFGRENTDAISLGDVAQGTGGFAMDGEAAYDSSGRSVSGAGDVNGDGVPDVIVGAPLQSPNGHYSGRAYVVLGKADTAPVQLVDVAGGNGGFVLDGEGTDDRAGMAVSGLGDLDGDGLDEIIVGAPHAGRVYVVFGKTSTDAVALADVAQGNGGFAVDGKASSRGAGWSVSGAGDVNGDGLVDILVGEPMSSTPGYSGRAYVVFGTADTNGVVLAEVAQGVGGFSLEGVSEYDGSGWSVSGAGDIDEDGLADVIVGSEFVDHSYVVFGKEDTDAVSLADVTQGIGGFALDGEADNDVSSESSVSAAGDVNGDGVPDLVIGMPDVDSAAEEAGRTYVVFGGDLCAGG